MYITWSHYFIKIVTKIILYIRGPRPVRNRTTQQEVSSRQASKASSATPHHSHYRLNHRSHYCLNHRSHYRLNHPPRAPLTAPSMEKLSSMKPVPGAKKVADHCYIFSRFFMCDSINRWKV